MSEEERIKKIAILLTRSQAGDELRPLFERLCEVILDEKRECQALFD